MSRRSDTTENQEFSGNISIVPNVNLSEGDGSLEVYGSVFTDSILPNTIDGPVNLQNTLFDDFTITISGNSQPINSLINSQKFFIDITDNKLKSIDSTNLLTVYQPTTTKGDLIVNNGTNTTRLPVGSNNQVLTVNNLSVNGIEWQTPTSSSNSISSGNIDIVKLTKNQESIIIDQPVGSFISTLSPLNNTGCSGNYIISKSNAGNSSGNIVLLSNNPSLNNNSVFSRSYPAYSGVTIISSANDNDANYKILNSCKFISNPFTLTGTSSTPITSNTTGAYFFSVYNYITGPCATFFICKSNISSNTAAISQISSSPGVSPTTQLSVTWPASSSFAIAKTTSSYNGTYFIKDNLQYTTNQITVTLTGTSNTIIPANIFPYYKQKSFFMSVIGVPTGSPNGIFSVSKNLNTLSGNIFSTVSLGVTSNERLNLTWNSNSLLILSKNGVNYNGTYIINFTQLT